MSHDRGGLAGPLRCHLQVLVESSGASLCVYLPIISHNDELPLGSVLCPPPGSVSPPSGSVSSPCLFIVSHCCSVSQELLYPEYKEASSTTADHRLRPSSRTVSNLLDPKPLDR